MFTYYDFNPMVKNIEGTAAAAEETNKAGLNLISVWKKFEVLFFTEVES